METSQASLNTGGPGGGEALSSEARLWGSTQKNTAPARPGARRSGVSILVTKIYFVSILLLFAEFIKIV